MTATNPTNPTTTHDLATQIATRHGVSFDFAAETVETYITQIEDIDDREIDRSDIFESDANFIIATFASVQRRGDFGVPELNDVADAANAVDQARNALNQAWSDRDRTIRHAIARGARIVDLMAVAGVSRARIDQIHKGAR